jgi:DNA-directed RNA polymerase specialized sigma24 family protein
MADYSDLPDPDLIARCLEQDAGAWEALVWRYERLIAATTYRCGLTAADAADVFQTVCLILLRHLAAVRKQETLSNWLITVTMRECWRFRRQGGPTASLDDPESGDAVGNLSAVPPLAESQILALE